MLDRIMLNRLREMKLRAMAEKLEWLMDKPETQLLTFEERVGMIVDAEWMAKHDRRIGRLVRQAGFCFPAVVEDIDYHNKSGINKSDILRLSECSFINRRQNLILTGPTGVGKSYIACALGRCACQLDIAVRYINISDLFITMGEARTTKEYMSFKKRLASVPLLIIDDWGVKSFTLSETHDLRELFELRYGKSSTLVSGQVPPEAWHGLFPDPTLADAILDRLIHNAYKFNLKGESMRKAIAEKEFAEAGALDREVGHG